MRKPPTNKAAWEDLSGGISSNKLNKLGQILGPQVLAESSNLRPTEQAGLVGARFARFARVRRVCTAASAAVPFGLSRFSFPRSPHAQFLYLPAQSGTLLPYLESSQTSPHPVTHSIDSARP